MRASSSHRDHRGSKMRFLIVSAVLACAAAAPSHLLTPVVAPVPLVAPVPIAYSAIPTLSPGDVQAAVIDAQVSAHDQAIAAADKARELSELASESINEKAVTDTNLVKENQQEALWSIQDKQWQVLDALKTAQAQLDGAIASNAPVLAKSAVLTPYIATVPAISPIVYGPGIIAPEVKAIEAPKEEKPVEKEALTKSAEEIKDSVVVEAAKENLEAKSQLAPVAAPIAIPYSYPIVAPLALSPHILKYSAFPQIALGPTIVKAW